MSRDHALNPLGQLLQLLGHSWAPKLGHCWEHVVDDLVIQVAHHPVHLPQRVKLDQDATVGSRNRNALQRAVNRYHQLKDHFTDQGCPAH